MKTTQVVELRRSRNFGDILNVTFEFLRVNMRQLLKAVLFISGPPMIVGAALFSASFGSLLGSVGDPSVLGSFVSVLAAALIFLVAWMIVNAVVNEYVVLYASLRRPVEVPEVWTAVRGDLLMILVTSVGSTLLITLGTVLLFIPGIWLYTVLSIILTVRIQERIGMGRAISRCVELTRGYWWFTFGVIVVMAMIAGFVGYVFQIPVIVVASVTGFMGDSDASAVSMVLVIATMIGLVGRLLVSSIQMIALAIHYYNLSEKYDGVGLMQRIESIGMEPAREDLLGRNGLLG